METIVSTKFTIKNETTKALQTIGKNVEELEKKFLKLNSVMLGTFAKNNLRGGGIPNGYGHRGRIGAYYNSNNSGGIPTSTPVSTPPKKSKVEEQASQEMLTFRKVFKDFNSNMREEYKKLGDSFKGIRGVAREFTETLTSTIVGQPINFDDMNIYIMFIKSGMNTLGKSLLAGGKWIISTIASLKRETTNAVKSISSTIYNKSGAATLVNGISKMLAPVGTAFKWVSGTVVSSVKTVVSGVVGTVGNFASAIKSAIGGLIDFKNALSQQFSKDLKRAMAPMKGAFGNMLGSIKSNLGGLFLLSSTLVNTGHIVSAIISTIGAVASKVMNYTDEVNLAQNKLKLVSKDNADYQKNKQLIYEASNNTYTSTNDFMNQVSKLQLSTNNSFGDTANAIKFVETLNKAFVIGGADESEKRGATLQITQAIGSGRLQGDEFRSVLENAPLIARQVAKTMGVPFEKLKEYSTKGKITADILKDAVLNAADEIDAKFLTMPKTWSQAIQQFKNIFQKQISQAAKLMENLSNSKKLNTIIVYIIKNIGSMISMVVQVISVVTWALGLIADGFLIVWKYIGKVITWVGKLTGSFFGLGNRVSFIVELFGNLRNIIVILISVFLVYKILMITFQVITWAATAAQMAFNLAMMLSPYGLIIAAIVIIIGVLMWLCSWFGDTGEEGDGLFTKLARGFGKMVGHTYNAIAWIWNKIVDFIALCVGAFNWLKDQLSEAFSYIWEDSWHDTLRHALDYLLEFGKKAGWLIDKIFGTNIEEWLGSFQSDDWKKQKEKISKIKIEDYVAAAKLSWGSLKLEYKNVDEYAEGYATAAKNWSSNILNLADIMTGTNQLISENGNTLDDINKSVKKEKKEWQEDIKLLTQLATRQAIINVTRPEVKVEATFNGTPTSIESKDIADTIADKISNTISAYANKGVN